MLDFSDAADKLEATLLDDMLDAAEMLEAADMLDATLLEDMLDIWLATETSDALECFDDTDFASSSTSVLWSEYALFSR